MSPILEEILQNIRIAGRINNFQTYGPDFPKILQNHDPNILQICRIKGISLSSKMARSRQTTDGDSPPPTKTSNNFNEDSFVKRKMSN